MNPDRFTFDRRSFLRQASLLAAAGLLAPSMRGFASLQSASTPDLSQQLRAAAANEKIRTTRLTDRCFLLQGVGGNVVCQNGPEGKLLIDAQMSTGAPHLLEAASALGPQPLRFLVNTHWHVDHTDGNEAMHTAGAFIIAHEKTRERLSTPQELKFYHLHSGPAPAGALPQQTFTETQKLYFNGDELDLVHAPNAHTDTDIYVHFTGDNVIHAGDLWFNGYFPLIDVGTGGTIHGMVDGCDRCIALADAQTKIVPGHGELGDRAGLKQYRDMLATVAERVSGMKRQGKSLDEVIAAQPTADLDAVWGRGSMKSSSLVTFAYQTV